jgi:hypothetical protein
MADNDIRKTVSKPEPSKEKVSEPVASSGDSPSSVAPSSTTEDSGSDLDGVADEEAPDPAAPVLAIVPGNVAEETDEITPTGNTPDAVQFPVTAPRLPGIYLDDVEKYQSEVKSAVMENREPDQALNPFSSEGNDVTSDHSPAKMAARSDHSNANAH